MNSVERVLHLVDNTPKEAPAIIQRNTTTTTTTTTTTNQPFAAQLSSLEERVRSTTSPVIPQPVRTVTDDNLLLNSGWPWKGGLYLKNVVMR